MKVGIVGLGVMGRNHARVLSEMKSVNEVILFDPLGDQQTSIGGRNVESSIESFLDQTMDYCVVSSPTSTHLEVGLRLASLKIPALIEKPLASSPEEGQRLVRAFSDAGVLAGVGHVERFNPATLAMKRELLNGLLGRIYQISTRRVGPFSGRVKDVGVAKDLASHDIDLVGWLSGSKYTSLDSRTLNPMGKTHEDVLVAVGTLASGALVSHQVNWVSPMKERLTSVLGENGLLVADTLSQELFHYKLGSSALGSNELHSPSSGEIDANCKFELTKIEPLVSEHLAFQEAIVNGGPWQFASLQEGLDVVKTAEMMLGNTRY